MCRSKPRLTSADEFKDKKELSDFTPVLCAKKKMSFEFPFFFFVHFSSLGFYYVGY